MADINELIKKYVPKNDVGVAGEDVFFDEKNNVVRVKNAYGTSLYDPSGKLLYGQGALYDTNIGSVSGKNVQIFGRNEEIGAAATGVEGFGDTARIERQRKEAAYASGGTKGLQSYLNTGRVSATATGLKTPEQIAADAAKAQAQGERQSAYDLLYSQFKLYGLESLVEPLKGLITSGASPAEFTIKLRETDAYKKRFAANSSRIQKGLRALSEAEYIGLEDQYQDVMRRYGLPDTYYARGDMGRQEGFEKFIGGDVSPVELEDRIQTAQRRVLNAAPQIKDALTQYYGNEISNGDILAYVLDPDKAIENIKRKVTAAEIGGAASIAGLGAGRSRAEELQRFGVTGEQARQGYNVISEFLPQARVLGERYAKQGLGDYTQETAESEVFAIPGSAEAGRKRRKLAELETAQFSGSTGVGALARERAGQF